VNKEKINIKVDDDVYEYINNLTINSELIVGFLRSKGLNDEQISELTLQFVAEKFCSHADMDEFGHYEPDTHTATVNMYSLVKYWNSQYYGEKEHLNNRFSDQLSDTIAHELLHAAYAYLDPKYHDIVSDSKSEPLLAEALERIRKIKALGTTGLSASIGTGLVVGSTQSPFMGAAVGIIGSGLTALGIKKEKKKTDDALDEINQLNEYAELIHERVYDESDGINIDLARVSLR
jgi:hypothetical protein